MMTSPTTIDNDITESSTLIPPAVTQVITEITNVFLKTITEVTIITELVDVFTKDVTRNGISQTHLTHLPIVNTAFSQIRDKNCKVIVDNESCNNAVFFEIFENDGLKLFPHSHLFKVP